MGSVQASKHAKSGHTVTDYFSPESLLPVAFVHQYCGQDKDVVQDILDQLSVLNSQDRTLRIQMTALSCKAKRELTAYILSKRLLSLGIVNQIAVGWEK